MKLEKEKNRRDVVVKPWNCYQVILMAFGRKQEPLCVRESRDIALPEHVDRPLNGTIFASADLNRLLFTEIIFTLEVSTLHTIKNRESQCCKWNDNCKPIEIPPML